ncbi:helix-turn-helix transcriptional regulator [Acetohalobium arabaticum]|uniref:YheO domain protein n=1 Tax=Acetohalobium arabaticum (strain ATCC 49924 / DSM 5501 / Z-7288) TaxID=574087 RepID=D9QQC3_ACEAZ|nr:helix-turn-helix transcriptional regulator [Acetohalobium arabaticum]ADL12714.1 YheO domain protein [Acetohalobium arabaticum DSM 5501]
MRILVDDTREVHPYLENVKSIAKGIHKFLGQDSEVVIHDLSDPTSSIIFLAGGLTDRELGGPVTDLVLKTLRQESNPEDIVNYRNQTEDGRTFKSSTLFIKDDREEVIGCLCINYDVTKLSLVQNIINNFCAMEEDSNKDSNQKEIEYEIFANDINDVLNKMIKAAIDQVNKPVPFMEKEDKLKVIEFLEQKSAFIIKGAVERIADDLGVSRYTVYNYLKEI